MRSSYGPRTQLIYARPQVTIKRIERNKRKHVTSVHGLEAFGMAFSPTCPCPPFTHCSPYVGLPPQAWT